MQGHHQFTLVVGNRRRYGHVAVGQVAHQVQIKRQLLERQVLKNREDVFAALGCQEKVAVLDTGSDAFDRDRLAEGELRDPLADIVQADRGKNCHEKAEL